MIFSEEFLVSASHQLALITFLKFKRNELDGIHPEVKQPVPAERFRGIPRMFFCGEVLNSEFRGFFPSVRNSADLFLRFEIPRILPRRILRNPRNPRILRIPRILPRRILRNSADSFPSVRFCPTLVETGLKGACMWGRRRSGLGTGDCRNPKP